MLTLKEWRAYEDRRQARISANRSRRMRSLPLLPSIPKLPRPRRVQIETRGGDYVGTWPYGTTRDDAVAEAIEAGAIISPTDCKCTMVA